MEVASSSRLVAEAEVERLTVDGELESQTETAEDTDTWRRANVTRRQQSTDRVTTND